MRRYNPKEIEPKWQAFWDKNQIYKTDLNSAKPKYYAMSMLNYPSGSGIHIGHAMNYTISDVQARLRRQQGFESYHPIGWDAFGLPAENYAIKSGEAPQKSMERIIPNYHKQYKAMGWSNDWSKEISTHDPDYYKWTQWIFCELYRHGLVYQSSRAQWWCPIDSTVLADEQVTPEGKCWRHDGPNDPLVEKKEIKQWFFKITDYTEELLQAIDGLDWSESVKSAQRNWIGKSQGVEIDFAVDGSEEKIKVFTTRPDTIFGATFLVLAPEHELVERLTTKDNQQAVETYQKQVARKSEVERQADKEKTGVFTGNYAINPASEEKIPIWISEYVLTSYGSGAIMAVPAHDERDNEFAKKFELPIKEVIEAPTFDEENPPREGEENTKRNVAICVVENSDGKVLTLKWNKLDWHNFPMGGVEEGENLVEAAKREITEETGYTDLEFTGRMPFALNSVFYAAHKDVNRDIRVDVLSFKLKTDNKISTKKEDHEDFDPVWTEKSEIGKLHPVGGLEYIVRWVNGGDYVYTGDGRLTDSGEYSYLQSADASHKIVAHLSKRSIAKEQILYRLQDWSVSRQRYWGAPVPVIYCDKCGPQLVPDADLPVVLPEIKDFEPKGDGRGALARASNDWLKVKCPSCGGEAERDTDTLDTYVDSAWYFLRYLDPQNSQKIFDDATARHWMPVDFYNGADHATAHMIYARFITRFFSKIGLLGDPEPFKKFLFNGKVVDENGHMFSKSKGNAPDPLEIVDQGYGADALRLYLMFAAPLDQWARWDPKGVPGTYRFLNRAWNLTQEFNEAQKDNQSNERVLRATHRAIKKVSEDIENLRYNTAIAAMMQLTNELYLEKASGFAGSQSWQFSLESLSQLMAPFAPHIAEELWRELGHDDSIHKSHWPKLDEGLAVQDQVKLAIQINGKVKAEIVIDPSLTKAQAIDQAKQKVVEHIKGKTIKNEIYVPRRIINFVI